jgi:cell wall-associated NlpC family hydrolase
VSSTRRHTAWLLAALAACCAVPAVGAADDGTGGVSPKDPQYAPPKNATIVDGKAVPPEGAPSKVVRAINAANRIVHKPYRYGGGHRSFRDRGYDCSGAVSYALRGARLIGRPLDSSDYFGWGDEGRGRWITVYTSRSHAFVVIAGLRFDTSSGGDNAATARRYGIRGGKGPRWRVSMRSTRGYVARHPTRL